MWYQAATASPVRAGTAAVRRPYYTHPSNAAHHKCNQHRTSFEPIANPDQRTLTPFRDTSMNHTPTQMNGNAATIVHRPATPLSPIDQGANPDARITIPSKWPKHECHSPLLQNASRTKRSHARLSAASTCRSTASKSPGSGWFGNEGSLSVSSGANSGM